MVRSIISALVAVVLCLFTSAPAFGLALGMVGDEQKLDIPVSAFNGNVDSRASIMVQDTSRPLDTSAISAMQVQWDRAERRSHVHAKRGTRPFRCPQYYTNRDLAETMAFTERRLSDSSVTDDARPTLYGMRYAGTFCSLGKPAKRMNKSDPTPAADEIALMIPVTKPAPLSPPKTGGMRLDPNGDTNSDLTDSDYLRTFGVSMNLVAPSPIQEVVGSRQLMGTDENDPSCATLEILLGRDHHPLGVVPTPVSSRSSGDRVSLLSNLDPENAGAHVSPKELARLIGFRAATYKESSGNYSYHWSPGPPR